MKPHGPSSRYDTPQHNYPSSTNRTDLHRRQSVLPSLIVQPVAPLLLSPISKSSDISILQSLGLNLKYVSLITLALQNAILAILMHYSRVSASPSRHYSAATAVLLNEVLKGSISFVVALTRAPDESSHHKSSVRSSLWSRITSLCLEICSSDCWKLSIPAILYVIQNNLQFVASANLNPVVFQVSYQMKILTTAGFSALLLRKRLNRQQWLSLLLLAVGVGIVQIQRTGSSESRHESGLDADFANVKLPHSHTMHPFRGFAAVTIACFTSGLAGVYFEMVVKGTKADLWVRNVQLSLFSIIPALVPLLFGPIPISHMFDHFGFWAWVTVLTQVFGGLITALVIKYSDNIFKGFATSLSIILSSLASVLLFDFQITAAFLLGASTVMFATWMYNRHSMASTKGRSGRGKTTPFPGSPVSPSSPILGEYLDDKHTSSPKRLGMNNRVTSREEFYPTVNGHTNGHAFMTPPLSRSTSARTSYTELSSKTPPPPNSTHSPMKTTETRLHLR